MIAHAQLPAWLRKRLEPVLSDRSGARPSAAASAAVWDRLDGRAQSSYLSVVSAELLEEAKTVAALQQRALL